jgi:WXXGXW repeat (2 copies)
MKQKILTAILCTILGMGVSTTLQAQHFYVKVEPAAPRMVRPAPPSRRHIWVENEWAWRNGAYVNVPGYWALPPRPRSLWIPGHWVHERRGAYWIPGHWR